MSFDQIPVGKDAPDDIYVAIEIPANSSPIKYEIDKDMGGALMVDRERWAFSRPRAIGVGNGQCRSGARSSELVDGAKGHRRLGDDDE